MKQRSTTRRLGWVAAAIALIGASACEQSMDPVGVGAPQSIRPAFAFDPSDPISHFEVKACKTGPAGTYSFTIAALTGSVTLPFGGSFTLDAGECKVVATTTTNAQRVSISEVNLPPNTVFDHADRYLFVTDPTHPVSGPPSFFSTTTASTLEVGNFGPDAGWVVNFVNVATPSTGCTLTLGYWKTHNESFGGGTPVDPTWALIAPSAEQSPFFLSGDTWFGVFWTSPSGNAYYSLAHQYMAAKLNLLGGSSSTPAVNTAISTAETLFSTYTPAQIGVLSGNDPLRKQFVSVAGVLGAYNEGSASGGPDHCQ